MLIRFELVLLCGDEEPSRYISTYRGQIFDYSESEEEDDNDHSEPDVKIGEIELQYVDHIQIINEDESLFGAMDGLSSDTLNCYKALIEQHQNDWKAEVQRLVGEDALIVNNILLINRLHLDEQFRGKGKGAEVIREVIRRFGSTCGVITCKPFPLQYAGYESEENAANRKTPGYDKNRLSAFRKVAKFWKSLGFHKLPSSDSLRLGIVV